MDAVCIDDLAEIVDGLALLTKRLAPASAVDFSQKVQQIFAGIELSKMADMKKAGASRRERERRATAGGTRSKKSASRASMRADVVDKNPKLADDVGEGALGDEQMDAIAHGADKTDGEAATDEKLIAKVKQAPADDADKIVSRWIEERDDENGTESRYERQRRRRGVSFGLDVVTDCETMTVSGDRESVHELRKRVKARADELYKLDGGRDVPTHKHPRTHRQRMFDALCQLIAEGANLGSVTVTPPGGSAEDASDAAPDASATPAPTPTTAPATPGPGPVRAMIHISMTVDDQEAEQIRASVIGGDGYLPKSVLEKYGCCSTIAGTVFDQRGEVLWFGRMRRHATPSQFAALVVRDRGCVLCGADAIRCEAHHVIPFNAPAQGETNIEELAMVCGDHHHLLHQEQLTLYWQLGPPDPDTGQRRRKWATRRARPEEVAPKSRRASADKQPRSRENRVSPDSSRTTRIRSRRPESYP